MLHIIHIHNTQEIRENFPQSSPMNVMYSDANGNLATSNDLLFVTEVGGKKLIHPADITVRKSIKNIYKIFYFHLFL